MQIALFVTCLTDSLFPEVGRATVAVLERLGHEVVFPNEQTCCGQMHVNSGYRDDGLSLARRFVEIFEPYEAVVSPSSSCVGNVRDAYPRLAREARDAEFARKAGQVAARTFELSELLVRRLGVTDVGARFPHRVAYHPTCHSLRVARVGDAPIALLRNVRDLQLVPFERADECCGFGGTFAIKNADTSSAILSDKCSEIVASEPEVCTAVDSSCLMHIDGGLSRIGSGVRTMHLAEILEST